MTIARRDSLQDVKDAAEALVEAGWFLPAYIQLGAVHALAARVRGASPEDRSGVLATGICNIYGDHRALAVMLLERYKVWPHIREFGDTISEALEAAALGLMKVATSALVPVVEGVIRLVATSLGVPERGGDNKALILATLDRVEEVGRARWNPGAFREVEVMLDSFRRYFKERFWQRSDRLAQGETLNRHGILHGLVTGEEFGSHYNFCRLVSILDLYCFLISVAPPSGARIASALAPDMTEEAWSLASYYAALGPVRVAAQATLGCTGAPERSEEVPTC